MPDSIQDQEEDSQLTPIEKKIIILKKENSDLLKRNADRKGDVENKHYLDVNKKLDGLESMNSMFRE